MSTIKNIFLSDDDADDRHFFQTAFEEVCSEHKLFFFDNNKDMLSKLKTPDFPKPELFFIDLNMPMVNGIECLRMIREIEDLKDVPVIIYSTVRSELFIEEVHELGAAYYIRKPYDFYELVNLIKYVVDLDWKPQSSPTPFEDFVLTFNTIRKPLSE